MITTQSKFWRTLLIMRYLIIFRLTPKPLRRFVQAIKWKLSPKKFIGKEVMYNNSYTFIIAEDFDTVKFDNGQTSFKGNCNLFIANPYIK